mmetsp:Transcript_21452/g.44859  ORF Transcript_21452/g.44859 Transcript_21452/m.44859 type:complete len:202 (-) Transcript_21452:670-1275(-)
MMGFASSIDTMVSHNALRVDFTLFSSFLSAVDMPSSTTTDPSSSSSSSTTRYACLNLSGKSAPLLLTTSLLFALTSSSPVTNVAAASALGTSNICINCLRIVLPIVALAHTTCTSSKFGNGKSLNNNSVWVGRAMVSRFFLRGGAPASSALRWAILRALRSAASRDAASVRRSRSASSSTMARRFCSRALEVSRSRGVYVL